MMENESKVPKKIHYCWFGNNKKSRLVRKCIESWHKLCPDYEIIEWNESNFDISCCKYVEQAYRQKKWAYVSDYVRFCVLNEYGGIYVDTDVQFLKNLDELLKTKFLGFARENLVATGLIMATTKSDWFCKAVLSTYENDHFEINSDPAKMYSIGKRTARILEEHGLVYNGKEQKVEDYTIYPDYYFNSTKGEYFRKPDKRAYTIHHYAASWFSPKNRIKNRIRRMIGYQRIKRIKSFLHIQNYL